METVINPRWTRRPEKSNWGDFGPDDQIGRMNLLTPARRLAAAAEIKTGECFALSLPLDYPGGTAFGSHRKPPILFPTKFGDGDSFGGGDVLYNLPLGIGVDDPKGIVNDDSVLLCTQYSTQWDALAHWGMKFDVTGTGVEDRVYYNGYRAEEHVRDPVNGVLPGATALGIENLAVTGAQGRAIVVSLLDEFGPGRTWVNHAMLMTAMEKQGAKVREGDFLLLHTGLDDAIMSLKGKPDEKCAHDTGAVLDGRDPALLDWVHASGVVALCSDNQAVEGHGYADCSAGNNCMIPLHELCLFKLGIHLGELWRLGDLSRWLLKNKRTACFLTAPPLRLPGAVGSPVTPVATV
jgi:kynurenine formamidase